MLWNDDVCIQEAADNQIVMVISLFSLTFDKRLWNAPGGVEIFASNSTEVNDEDGEVRLFF